MAKKNRRKYWLMGLLLLLVIAIAGVYFKNKNKPKGIAITKESVSKRTIIEKVSASGKVFPETEIKISSDVSGEIVELFVEEGDSVMIGQVLAKIDPEAFKSAVDRGRATVNNSKAQVALSKSQIQSNIAQKEQIIAQLENAQNIHQRNEKLLKDGVISPQDFEQSESNLLALQANLRAAEASIQSAQQSAEGAEYSVQSAEASLKELQTNLNRTTIKAPATGVVSSLSVEQGERVVGTIQMTGTEMMRIANLSAMEVQVDVSENDILRVSLGDSVDIEVDAYLDKIFKGTITEIANSASNISTAGISLNSDQVTNFIVKIRIDPSSYQNLISQGLEFPFRPGMSASVDIYTHKEENVITVPIQSVTTREEETDGDKEAKLLEVVFAMEADTARMIEVSTGIQDDDYIIVTAGLEEGQEIITGPYNAVSKTIKEGSELRVKEDKEDQENE